MIFNPEVLNCIVVKLNLPLKLGLGIDLDLDFIVDFKGLMVDLEFGGLDLDRS